VESENVIEIRKFLKDYPGMAIVPSKSSALVLKGVFTFKATLKGRMTITDSYQIQIAISDKFPRTIPTVTELSRKIPRDGKHHVNPDGSLCMGSPIRLLQKIYGKPNLVGFSESCLVPYLYAVSYKLQTGEDFPFGELDHGNPGIIDDYMVLFGLNTQEQVMWTLTLIGMKRRMANKKVCPCKCNFRLGKCAFRYKINGFRNMAPRSWFKKQVLQLQARN
jgi:hypothetical protein